MLALSSFVLSPIDVIPLVLSPIDEMPPRPPTMQMHVHMQKDGGPRPGSEERTTVHDRHRSSY
jgi:hypothetical protein